MKRIKHNIEAPELDKLDDFEKTPKWQNKHRVGVSNPRNPNIREMYPIPVSDHILPENAKKYKGKHEESMAEEVARLARFGCTNEEIAEFYNITIATFQRYERDIKEFRDALMEGRMLDSMKSVDSLHKQALGYFVEEEEEAEHVTRQGDIVTLKKKTKKWIQPSATAAIYLLKTRHGDKWMDIIRTEANQNLNITVKNVDFSDMSNEELIQLKNLGIKRIPEEFTGRRHNKELPTQDVRGN